MRDIPITSECPKCGEDRVQYGQDPEELIQMLRYGASIPAYCMACDEHWEMSLVERAAIAQALNG